MSQILKKIAKNTRYYRLKKKLTQKQLAKKAKMSRGFVNRIENARVNIYLTTLYEIAKALGVSARDLVI
jgi:transcriptional regulator with XRE-family HTH domain